MSLILFFAILQSIAVQSRPETSYGLGEEPSFSPDGTKIAFVRSGRIWAMDVRTRKTKSLTPYDNNHSPSWSPDGKNIAYQSGSDNRSGSEYFSIWVVGSNGSDLKRITNTDSTTRINDQNPHWSRDGAQIAWTHGNQIWIMNSDGTNARPFTSRRGVTYEYACDFSPDGKQLVYLANDDESSTYRIRILSISDRNQSNFSNGIVALGVRWSTDGRYLYYNTGAEVMKIRADAKEGPKSVYRFEEGLYISSFDISRDDKHIVYDDSGAERDGTIYVGLLH